MRLRRTSGCIAPATGPWQIGEAVAVGTLRGHSPTFTDSNWSPERAAVFDTRPNLQQQPIGGHLPCLVFDNALRDPQTLVDMAVSNRSAFVEEARNGFPGLALRMPQAFNALLNDFFLLHVRGPFGVRRIVRSFSRLSMVTRSPVELTPLQRVCHRDYLSHDPGQRVFACVLYLFRDAAMGGTSFYRPRRSEQEINDLRDRWARMSSTEFTQALGMQSAYLTESTDHFERVCTVSAAWNRLIFYDSTIFHSGDISQPDRMVADPASGRLTLNGFFVCRPSAGN